ncbi:hypothetical protein D3C76_1456200 [compost metagenome]
MGGGAPTIQQTALGQHERRGANRRHHGALLVLLPQPRPIDGEGRQGILEGEEEPGNQHQVGAVDLGQPMIDPQHLPSPSGNRSAVERSADHLKWRTVAEQVGRIQHFQGNGGGGGRTVLGQ